MSFNFNQQYPNATNDDKWNQIRIWRNLELSQTDWTQLPDSPVDKDAWAEYRQALRDLPEQGGEADEVDLPNKP
jgi:hypothetical protein